MIRTGRGPFLSSVGIGCSLAVALPLLGLLVAVVGLFVLCLFAVMVAALLAAGPAALVLGVFGFLHLSEEVDGGFVDAVDPSVMD